MELDGASHALGTQWRTLWSCSDAKEERYCRCSIAMHVIITHAFQDLKIDDLHRRQQLAGHGAAAR